MVQHFILQGAIEKAISHPTFAASLPPLSDNTWMKILAGTPQARVENERLEFVGDALMYATLGRQLYTQLPNGTPHLFTCVRAVLHSNATFSLLAEKLDIMAVSNPVLQALTKRTFGEGACAPNKTRPQVKATADLFETVIGAYYFDHGFEALYTWVEEIYTPLIKIVSDTFYQYQHGPYGTYRGPGAKKRTVEPFVYKPGPLTTEAAIRSRPMPPPPPTKKTEVSPIKRRLRTLEKIRTHAARASPHPSAKSSIIGTSSVKPKVKSPSKRLSESKKPVKQVCKQVTMVKQAPIFIDLTLDSDLEDSQPLVRHPLVTPRIPRRSSAVSKQRAPAPVSAPPPPPPGLGAADEGSVSASDSEDDALALESMLIYDSCSDMDCGSSDAETLPRPSSLAPCMSRPRLDMMGLDPDIARPPSYTQRPVSLR